MTPFQKILGLSTLTLAFPLLNGCSANVGTTVAPPKTAAPTATLTPTTVAFGNQTVATTSSSQSITLSNTGDASLTNIVVSLTGANAADFADMSACGSTLAAGSSCNILVTFTPASAASFTATLSVADNASGSPQTSSLTGAGTTPAPPVYSEVNSCTSSDITSPAQPTPIANFAGAPFTGTVQAGSLPVIGSSVQLYAAGRAGKGSSPTALLPTPLLTDANGNFSVSATFTCPYNTSVIYVVATGGVAGTGGAPNAGTVLATVLGTCESVANGASFVINEATTVAAATAMAPFLAPGGQMGSSATNSLGIALAAATTANLVNVHTGLGPGASFPANGTAPTARINSLANVLDACIISAGPSSNACAQLYTATTSTTSTPTNTLDAALNLASNPANNVAALYSLSTGSSAYEPVLEVVPADWTMFVNYTGGGMNSPSTVAIDSVGNVWVANYFYVASLFSNTGAPLLSAGVGGNNLYESFGAAVNVNDVISIANEESLGGINSDLGSISIFNNTGSAGGIYASGGIDFPLSIAYDTSGTLWIADYADSHVTLLNPDGSPYSGASGYTSAADLFLPQAIATDSKCNAYLANSINSTITLVTKDGSTYTDFTVGAGADSNPDGLAVDASDNVWAANYYGNSVGLVSKGQVLSGDGFTNGGIQSPVGIAVDGAGNAWVANYHTPPGVASDTLTELAGVASGDVGKAISPNGYGVDAGIVEGFGIAIDAGGSVWVSNFGKNALTEFIGIATPVKTPLLGPVRIP